MLSAADEWQKKFESEHDQCHELAIELDALRMQLSKTNPPAPPVIIVVCDLECGAHCMHQQPRVREEPLLRGEEPYITKRAPVTTPAPEPAERHPMCRDGGLPVTKGPKKKKGSKGARAKKGGEPQGATRDVALAMKVCNEYIKRA